MTAPTPPRRDDLTEISDELVERALATFVDTFAGGTWEDLQTPDALPDKSMRAALAAVLPDDRARVEREVLDRCAEELRAAMMPTSWIDVMVALRALVDRWSRR